MRTLAAAGLSFFILATGASAGTLTGTVELLERGGRRAVDVSDVVVYVEGAKGRVKPTSAVMSMKSKAFVPRVVVVPVGGTVEFPNFDPILHNAFSVSGENRFDLDLYRKPKTGVNKFEHPGVVRVYCNIHPQMSGVVLVRDNPYFTKANADGTFSLEGVPAGKYRLVAWHERGNEVAQEVTVPANGTLTTRLILDTTRFKRVQHKNKYGQDYSTPSGSSY